MSHLKLATVIFAVLGFTVFVWASEADELRAKAEAMRREAAELTEQGHREEAENLERRAMAMLKEAERHARHRPEPREAEVMELKRLLERLHQEEENLRREDGSDERIADVRREAEHVERELQELSNRPHREHGEGHGELGERLEHTHMAIEHLKQAGLHDIAEHVAQRAEAMERELHQHRPHHDGDVMHAVMQQLEELRHEIGKLRDEVNGLRDRP
ncbi:MAG: hypothetical protein P8J37_13020 [Fuerstiella sp.]|nr:hypothetical protein [Fuerstiella sp.]